MTRFPRPFVVGLVFLAVLCISLAAQAAGQRGGQRGQRGPGGMFGGPMFGGMRGGGLDPLMLAGDAAVQTKLGIADKKAAIEKLATESREANRKAMQDAFANAGNIRDMEPEARTKLFAKMAEVREKAQQATEKKLKDLLGEAKHKQLMEVRAGLLLRERGPTVVIDPSIAAMLKLTDAQKEQIQKAVEKYSADRMELFGGRGRGGRGGARGPRAGAGAAASSGAAQLIFVAAPAGGQRGPGRPNMEEIREKMQALRKAVNKAISAILTQSQKDEIAKLIKGVEGLEMPRPQFGRRGMGGGREGGRQGGRQGGRRRGGGDAPPQ